MKNIASEKINEAKQSYYESLFDMHERDAKKSWKTIRNLMDVDNTNTSVKELIVDGISLVDNQNIADAFNSFFTEVGIKLDSQLPCTNISPLSWMPPPRFNSFYLAEVTERECLRYIYNLKNTKSSLDEIPITIFKQICPLIITPFVQIINLFFKN